jgi:hypothetical protein
VSIVEAARRDARLAWLRIASSGHELAKPILDAVHFVARMNAHPPRPVVRQPLEGAKLI